MRGLLLITVAVILIVLGLRTSKGELEPEQNKTEAPAPVGEGPRSVALSNPAAALGVPEAPNLVVGDDPELLVGEGDRELPFLVDSQPQAAAQGEDLGGEPVPAWDGKLDPRGADVAIQEATVKRIDLSPAGGDGTALAKALIDAWISQDRTLLQAALDRDHGSQAGQDQARLAGLFWQAMIGRPEGARSAWQGLSDSGNATPVQLEMLHAAMNFDSAPAVPEYAGRRDPLARSMRMVLLDVAASRYQDSARYGDAARSLSELLMSEVHAPWDPHRAALVAWAQRLNTVQKSHRLHPRGEWPSITYRVEPNESLELIRKRLVQENPGLLLCTGLIGQVNQIGRYIHPGDVLRIPTEPSNMLVDLDARMAFYRHGSEVVRAWDVGIGREGKDTPVGTFTIGDKLKEPVWTRRNQPALPFGHPDNLLGARWLGWYQDGTKTDYGFHGTNDESGVGDRVSSGCIRMRNLEVEELFELLPQGAQVVVQP